MNFLKIFWQKCFKKNDFTSEADQLLASIRHRNLHITQGRQEKLRYYDELIQKRDKKGTL